MEAKYYVKLQDQKVKCLLCPHNCIIDNKKDGICKVRRNENEILTSLNYGVISSMGFDPIEKKPLYHFFPGSEILSIGSLGCNLKCQFCQNWQISQCGVEDFSRHQEIYTAERIVDFALTRKDNIGIAYTYNEPTVFFEFMLETAILSKKAGLMNVMVSNGFINKDPLNELFQYMDAFNIDLKAFSENFYRKYTKSQLEPVKETIKNIAKSGKHIEITNLVIPSLNDDEDEFEEMMKWISDNVGSETVMHLSRYHPNYEMDIESTSINKMIKFKEIAEKYLHYVYLGNVLLSEGSNTHCPECNELLILRSGFSSKVISINDEGNCMHCGNHILNFKK